MRIVKANHNQMERFEDFIDSDDKFSSYIDWRENHAKDYKDDVADMYNYIHHAAPKIESPEEKPLMMEFLNQNHQEFIDMKKRSKGNPVLSYLAAKQSAMMYDEIIDGRLADAAKTQKQAQEAKTDAEKQQLQQKLGEQMGKAKTQMKLEVHKKIGKAKEEFDKQEEALRVAAACAGTDTGRNTMSVEKQMELLELMEKNGTVKEVMALAGHSMNLAHHKLMSKTDGHESIVGIKRGNHLPSLISSEAAMLMDDDFKSLQELKLIQGRLLQYKYKGKKPKTGGPVVLSIDGSASMRWSNLVPRSRAFMFGMWKVAKAENREFYVIEFGGRDCIETTHVKSFDDIMRLVTTFMDAGGTDYITPLKKSMEIINAAGEFDNADIVFITDGDSRTDEEFEKEFASFKKKTSTKMIGVALTSCVSVLERYADQVVYGYDDALMSM